MELLTPCSLVEAAALVDVDRSDVDGLEESNDDSTAVVASPVDTVATAVFEVDDIVAAVADDDARGDDFLLDLFPDPDFPGAPADVLGAEELADGEEDEDDDDDVDEDGGGSDDLEFESTDDTATVVAETLDAAGCRFSYRYRQPFLESRSLV